MKKYLILASAALVALAACNKEPIEAPVLNDDTINLTFTAVRPQLDVETKTEWDAATSSIVWSSTDKIRIAYTLNNSWMGKEAAGTAKLYASEKVTIDSEDPCVGTFVVPVSTSAFTNPGTNGNYVFYGLYPSSSVSVTDAADAPVVSVSIPSAQTPKANSFDPTSDILVGKSKVLTISGIPTDPIEIDWTRVVAHGFLTFKDFKYVEEGETITAITLTAQDDANLAGTENISLANGSYSATKASNKIVINATNLAFVSETVNEIQMINLKAWISILPETLTSLDVDVETNKAHYTRSISGISKTFKQNAKNNLTINMASATRTAKTVAPRLFEDGDYLITVSSTEGGNKMMAAASPMKAVDTSNEIEDGKYKAEKAAVWTIVYNSTDGTYSIKSVAKEQYLTADLTFDSDPVFFTATEVSTGVYNFSITNSGSKKYISYNYNNGSDRFGIYVSSSNYVKDITLLPAIAKEEQQIIETPMAGTDVLNLAFTGVSGTTYSEWGYKKGSSTNAYYIGQSAGTNSSITLRTNNNNSGIVVWKSSGYVKSITVTWNSNTSNGRTLDIYAKNTAYEAPTDLYVSDKQGTKVGSIVKGTSTKYTFTDNYKYVGLRSNNNALSLDEIEIEWGTDAILQTVATPSIAFDPSTNQVSISCATEGATIYYTTNGSDPTNTDTNYSSAIQLVSGDAFTVKAIATKSGMNNSAVASRVVAYYTPPTGSVLLTVSATDFPSSYPSEVSTITVSEISLSFVSVANYGSGIQFKKSNAGYIFNTTSLGTISRIIFVEEDGKSHAGLKVYAGSNDSNISNEINASGLDYDFTGGTYSFFKIINTGSTACYLSKFIVEYQN